VCRGTGRRSLCGNGGHGAPCNCYARGLAQEANRNRSYWRQAPRAEGLGVSCMVHGGRVPTATSVKASQLILQNQPPRPGRTPRARGIWHFSSKSQSVHQYTMTDFTVLRRGIAILVGTGKGQARIRRAAWGKNRENDPCDATNQRIRCTGQGKNRKNDPCDATNQRIRCTSRGATRQKCAVCAMHATNRRIRCTGQGKNRKNAPCDATNPRIRCTSRCATRQKCAVCAMHATNRRIRCTGQGKNRQIGTSDATNRRMLCKPRAKMTKTPRGVHAI
jgi:hypothetical protein